MGNEDPFPFSERVFWMDAVWSTELTAAGSHKLDKLFLPECPGRMALVENAKQTELVPKKSSSSYGETAPVDPVTLIANQRFQFDKNNRPRAL